MEEFYQNILVLSLLSLISVTVIIGNSLVILAWLTQKRIRTPSNAYITSLAFCDLLVGLIVAPADIAYQLQAPFLVNNPIVCQLRIMSLICFCTVSIFHLIAIAWDRYRTVIEGVTYIQQRSLMSVLQVVIILWVIAIWISLPPVMSPHDPQHCQMNKTFHPQLGFALHVVFGSFLFPTFLMIVLYSRVYSAIQNRLKRKRGTVRMSVKSISETDETDNTTSEQISAGAGSRESSFCKNQSGECKFEPRNVMKSVKKKLLKISLLKEKKAVRTLSILIGAVVICWFPAFMFIVVSEIYPKVGQIKILFRIFGALGYANSAVNPIVYAIYNKEFRRAFKQILGIKNSR